MCNAAVDDARPQEPSTSWRSFREGRGSIGGLPLAVMRAVFRRKVAAMGGREG
jgi:hypothetical protein